MRFFSLSETKYRFFFTVLKIRDRATFFRNRLSKLR
jgi:hypothetical protein